jgi:hypothetical protein
MATGEIQNRKRFRQVVNFDALRYGSITPTDIDGFIDFGNKLFVLIEFKLKDVEMSYGQQLAIERLIDNLWLAHKKAFAIIAEHEFYDTDQDIDVFKCKVVKIRYLNKWKVGNFGDPKHVIDRLRDIYLLNKL